MFKVLVVFISFLSISSLANAAQAERDTVESLLLASGADTMLDSIYNQMEAMSASMAQKLNISEEERPEFLEHMAEVTKLMRAELNWETLKDPMIDLYMQHYTEKELQDMLAFYQSETGQSMVKKMPEVMAASMQMTQGMVAEIFPQIEMLTKSYTKRLMEQRQAAE